MTSREESIYTNTQTGHMPRIGLRRSQPFTVTDGLLYRDSLQSLGEKTTFSMPDFQQKTTGI